MYSLRNTSSIEERVKRNSEAAKYQPRSDANQKRQKRRRGGYFERVRQPLEIERADRHLVVERLAQFAGRDVFQEAEILNGERTVEAPFGAHSVEVLGARARLGHQGYRIAGQPYHREDREAP